jgi:cbb3-type cytochrome oxidase subunit 3
MMKDAVRALEMGAAAEIGLIAFVVAFLAMVAYAFTLSRKKRDEIKHLPLDDLPEHHPGQN